MANNDLEKYAKALDKYVLLVWLTVMLNQPPQCHHEVPHAQDGGSERRYETLME